MRYTEAEVDAVALAIANAERADDMLPPASHVDRVRDPDSFRRNARAALAARDALFETVAERYEVHSDDGYYEAHSRKDAHEVARNWRRRKFTSVKVVRVTTKRRKR